MQINLNKVSFEGYRHFYDRTGFNMHVTKVYLYKVVALLSQMFLLIL